MRANEHSRAGRAVTPTQALGRISLGVLLSSSPWLAGTAVAPFVAADWNLSGSELATLTTAVQLGFISGTAIYAATNLADILPAARLFLLSSLLVAAANGAFALCGSLPPAVLFRFLTGFFLAGVYPVGMKLVATWFHDGLGWRLGVMVGALVAGSGLPYLARASGQDLSWRVVAASASALALGGGLLVAFGAGAGPYLRGRARFRLSMMFRVFRERGFRQASLGYFGHMWELYAFWATLGLFLGAARADDGAWSASRTAGVVFAVMVAGAIGCVVGGRWSRRMGERRVALVCLLLSGCLCLLSGWIYTLSALPQLALVLLWGAVVVADSPQFSALASKSCPPEYTGTALTVMNGIGFGLTIVSIQWLAWWGERYGFQHALVFLAPGPLLGAWWMRSRSHAGVAAD